MEVCKVEQFLYMKIPFGKNALGYCALPYKTVGYGLWDVEKCWLLMHITVDSMSVHKVALFEQFMDEGRH
jgi:hypothetical protein